MLWLLKRRGLDVAVLTCEAARPSFVSEIEKLGLSVYKAPYRIVKRYPDMIVQKELVQSCDVVWISDTEYLVAPRVKRIDRTIPVIAHIRSATLVCPESHAFYGHREMCMTKCSTSRIIRCKQLSVKWLGDRHILGAHRMRAYWLLDYVKAPADFISWPMRDMRGIAGSIDGFIALSRWTKDLVQRHFSELEGVPIQVIPNPIVAPERGFPRQTAGDGMRILYASGAFPEKGPHIAICAARELLNRGHREFLLTMLGVKGIAWIEHLVRELGMEKNIEMLPRLKREEVLTFMANSNIVLMPSLAGEAFGRVAAEANIVGTPAIVSTAGGLPDVVVDNVTGLVTQPSPQAFAESMVEGLARDWDRERIMQTTLKRFDPERIMSEFVHFLETFVSDK